MLIKEYRISLPMSVEEYRIAQLYMIQKKSREESQGAGSGVEIITNKPYTGGPGGNGQYTYKIYHIGSHLPAWIKAILPKSALRVEEEAWNAYPYTKTRYRCPFVEKFVLEIETKYLDDGGEKENVFNMTSSEVKERVVDYIDIVKDQISSGDYKKDEDPKLFKSLKTKRGPLNDNWREEYSRACKDPNNKTKAIMTAYKLCRVEFKYWGMQTKIERFIHDIGLRKTMLRAHRQAWAWQDEYYGLQLSDIRKLELETQLALQEKMAAAHEEEDDMDNNEGSSPTKNVNANSTHTSTESPKQAQPSSTFDQSRERSCSPTSQSSRRSTKSRNKQVPTSKSKTSIESSQVSDWRFQSLEQLQESSSDEDEEFYDAEGLYDSEVFNSDLESDSESISNFNAWGSSIIRSNSMETLSVSNDEFADARSQLSFDPDVHTGRRFEKLCQKYSLETGHYDRHPPVAPLCRVNSLFMVIHGGSMLDPSSEHFHGSKRSDYATLKAMFDSVIKSHYQAAKGQIALRLVPCPHIGTEALNILSSLSPFGFDAMTPSHTEGSLPWSQEFVPLGAVALFSACSPEYQDHVNSVIAKANIVFMDFLESDEGKGFNGQVCILADATGSLLTYDALCRTRSPLSRSGSHYGSQSSDINEDIDRNRTHGSTHTLVEPESVASNETVKLTESSSPGHSQMKPIPEMGQNGDENSTVKDAEDHSKLGRKKESVKSRSVTVGKEEHDRTAPKVMVDLKGGAEATMRHPGGHSPSVRLHVTQSLEGTEGARRTSTGSQYESLKFDFEVADFFMLGSPLGLVLAYRRVYTGENKVQTERPDCQQMYNLFHASDPSAFRLEPLVNFAFKQIPPIKICRYNKFPMGDGESIQIVETICHYVHMFSDQQAFGTSSQLLMSLQRQESITSTCSQLSMFTSPGSAVSHVANVSSKWWGSKRLDYMLYCPEILHTFPVRSLPPLFHASFWESSDVVAFVLRQVLHQEFGFSELTEHEPVSMTTSLSLNADQLPKEKWQKRRTMYKVRNLQPNHRGNDVIVQEDKQQVLTAKFMYGPLDMTSLSGEKTDIHILSSTGEWTFLGTENTDGHGKLTFTIPKERQLSQGIYPVKMVVRVDHTTADLFLAVLPRRTETVVFSIDGSFTASVSIMGKDPKVKPGAVDVVRHWQELGYLILYVTARPDMQHNKVVAWLAQHNFPHGMVAFMDGFSKEPLKQKFAYLKQLQTEAELSFRAGYGSSKDINGYRDLGLKKEQIFIVGKSSKKQQNLATFISSGYAMHLEDLMNPIASRPASGNGIFLMRKGCFSLSALEHKRSSKNRPGSAGVPDMPGFIRQESLAPQTMIRVGEQGHTMLESVLPSVRARGTSPRPKIGLDMPR